jgi:hypothetical protein
MKRNHWLVLLVLVLLVGNAIFYYGTNWGLVTIHSENRPLAEIIRSIEKQGGVTVKTNMDGTTPVRMHVDKVKVAEAMETLSTLTESRWRLTYFVAADKGAISNALGTIAAGERPKDWKMLFIPAPSVGPEPPVPPDPRRDAWEVKTAAEPTLQAYLQQASKHVSAAFLVPEGWNPPVKNAPKPGAITKALPKLVNAVNGQYQEVFMLTRGGRRDRGGDGPGDGDGPRFGDGGPWGGFDREAMEERIQIEINKLPPAARAEAQKEHNERKAFFEEMRNLPPEQRMAKIQDMMNNPAMEERMEKGMSARDARSSPQQKLDRARKYLDRKAQSKARAEGGGSAAPGGRP